MNNEKIIYDTDCLSCFIVIDDVSILKKLFDKIIIPNIVYDELCFVKILCKRVNKLIDEGFVIIEDINTNSKYYRLYNELCYGYTIDKMIGKGEAAAISLAVKHDGILASNNTNDIKQAVKKFGLKRIKTGDIIVKAFNDGIINKKECENIWKKMIDKNRYLTRATFSDYLKEHPKSLF